MTAPVLRRHVELVLDRHPTLAPAGFACGRCQPHGGWPLPDREACPGCGAPADLLTPAAVHRVGAVTALAERVHQLKGPNPRATATALTRALASHLALPGLAPGEVTAGFLLAGFQLQRLVGRDAALNAAQASLSALLPGSAFNPPRRRSAALVRWR